MSRAPLGRRLRVAYFGSGAFGVPTLEAVASRHELVAVVTQPDRPAGRGGLMTPTPVGAWVTALGLEIPVHKPERVGAAEVVSGLRGSIGPGECDAWVVIAYGQKLPAALLESVFAVNLHASLLPRWRGAAPIHAAILAGDVVTGNSVITLADRMDAGLILGQSRREIDAETTTGELHDLLASDGPGLVLGVLDRFVEGRLEAREQDPAGVTIATKLGRGDATPNFELPAVYLRRQIHAFNPWPGVSAVLNVDGGVRVKLLRARVEAESGGADAEPGTIVDPARGVVVCGGGGLLCIKELKPSGRSAMSWEAFARGRSLRSGARLEPAP